MPKNKDYFGFVELDGFACWAVAESFDNDSKLVSARLAVETVLNLFEKKPTISKNKLESYVKEAHNQLKIHSGKFQLKASIMVVATNYKQLRYANCGNCRLHIFRGDALTHKSEDQSLYQDMVKQGQIPNDELHAQETRNLHNYLGKAGIMQIDVSKKIDLYDEDVFVLSTWGFWEKVTTLEMLDSLEDCGDPEEYVELLQDLFLSKQELTVNNYTVAAVFTHKTYQVKDNRKKIILIASIVLAALLVAGTILGVILYRSAVNRAELIRTIGEREQRANIHLQDRRFDSALNEYDSAIENSEDLRGSRGRRGRENQEIRDNLNLRRRIAQLIADGEALFDESNYPEARDVYRRALAEARSAALLNPELLDLLDPEYIEGQIELSYDREFIRDLVLTADAQAALSQFELALDNYETARNLALDLGDIQLHRDISLLMERAKSQAFEAESERIARELQQAEQERAIRIQENEITELEADRLLREGDFEGATNLYTAVQRVYLELGEVSRAAAVEEKIANSMESIRQQGEDEQATIAQGYLNLGDNYMIESNFDRALDNYRIARDIFTTLRRAEDVTIANERISIATTRQTEANRDATIFNIMMIENQGDELLINGDYAGARERYMQAQIMFRNINEMDRVIALEEKIRGVRELEALSNQDEQVEEAYG